jgi:membrane fusion protein, multidrug efflux system
VRFRGEFENADLKLYPNQFVNARLLVKTLQNAVLVPAAAVQHNGTQAFVYVVSGNTVNIRLVNELTTESGMAAVTGLNAGDTVPVTGFDKLQDGSKINPEGQTGKTASSPGQAQAGQGASGQ